MVLTAVSQIKEECMRILEFADNLPERIDIFYGSKSLKESLERLLSEFNKENYDETNIAELKKVCEADAIKLEYCIMRFNEQYKKRYTDRVQITRLNESVRARVAEAFSNKETVKMGQLLAVYAKLDELLEESKHICFSLTQEQYKLLDILKEEIEKDYSNLKAFKGVKIYE